MQVDFVGLAFEQESARGMTEDVDVWILRGANQALSVVGLGLAEALMDAGHDHIKLGQHVIGQIEFARDQNIHFDAGEQPKISALILETFVDLFNLLDLIADTRLVQAVGLPGGFGVIGYGPVLAAELDRKSVV